MRIEARPLRWLTTQAVQDASQRRLVPAVLVISVLSLFMMDSCTSCNANVVVEGEPQSMDLSSLAGLLTFGLLAIWSIALAGLLASDHLREIFEDGSATLWLTRPISRPTLALGRLLGSLIVSLGAALLLCGGASFFLSIRGDLPLLPAIWATLSVLLSCVTIASLAMMASLFLPRLVTVLMVFGGVGLVAVLNLASAAGRPLAGLYYVVHQFGPPILSAVMAALSPWWATGPVEVSVWDVALRSISWALGSLALLLIVFDQIELSRLEDR